MRCLTQCRIRQAESLYFTRHSRHRKTWLPALHALHLIQHGTQLPALHSLHSTQHRTRLPAMQPRHSTQFSRTRQSPTHPSNERMNVRPVLAQCRPLTNYGYLLHCLLIAITSGRPLRSVDVLTWTSNKVCCSSFGLFNALTVSRQSPSFRMRTFTSI
jgi:hypothetical protein